jgi:hypothetical protein
MEGVALVPVQEIHALLQRVAGELGLPPPVLPTEYRFRLKEIRVKRTGAADGAGGAAGAAGADGAGAADAPAEPVLNVQSKMDVCEVWLTYFPLLFVQPWGYRRALMGDLQITPVAWLSVANYHSLEFCEEAPQRTGPRRLEFQYEARNSAPRRVYRPMMAAGDLLRFLSSAAAQRGRGADAEAAEVGPEAAEAGVEAEAAAGVKQEAKQEKHEARAAAVKAEAPAEPPPPPGGPVEPVDSALRRARRFCELELDCAGLGARAARDAELEPLLRRARAVLNSALVEAAAGLLEAIG